MFPILRMTGKSHIIIALYFRGGLRNQNIHTLKWKVLIFLYEVKILVGVEVF